MVVLILMLVLSKDIPPATLAAMGISGRQMSDAEGHRVRGRNEYPYWWVQPSMYPWYMNGSYHGRGNQ